jgi:hypothetical protein
MLKFTRRFAIGEKLKLSFSSIRFPDIAAYTVKHKHPHNIPYLSRI